MLTKSAQVEKKLRRAIARGVYSPGNPLPTEMDLVRKFKVCRITVRDALNSMANDGLVERKQGAGTFVAQSLKKSHVAVLANLDRYHSTVSSYSRVLVDEINKLIVKSGFQPNFAVAQGSAIDEIVESIHLLEQPIVKKMLGLISLSDIGDFSRLLDKKDIPNVSIVTAASDCSNSVLLDYQALSDLAKKQFRKNGIEDFAVMFRGPFKGEEKESHFKGYYQTVVDSVSKPENRIEIKGTRDCAGAYYAFKDWWKRSDRPNAIFFWDDSFCQVACNAILEFGIRIPQDLKVLTLANKGRDFLLPYQLTSVGFDLEEVARLAWKKLQSLIKGEIQDEKIKVQPKLFEGLSLGESDCR